MDEQQRINAIASSSMMSSKKNDVFLSFRGEDTRRNFTSHLYKALNEKKVKTYIDDKLEKGDEISPALIKAIEDSHVSIVIFSENYASSKWCLGELTKILECQKEKGLIVMPVFYNIDPSHVRKQAGSYEKAFANHEGDLRCNQWKIALTEAANLAGWNSETYRTDLELLENIVGDVLKKLPPRYLHKHKGLVGIEKHCNQVESLLKIESSEIVTVGIWGMGGVGKTTLAKALYDKLSHDFEGCCFLTNVSEKSNMEALCGELFSKLSGDKNNSFDYSQMSSLQHKKYFIVLDDVATSEQLKKLIVEYDILGPGSRVIVTSRNKQIFGPNDKIYQVNKLRPHHSLQLFCLSVFGKKQPKKGYEDLSRRVTSYCQGIPLALTVLGASLRERSKEVWECELRKLNEIPKMEILNVLKLSYDDLDRSQKDIFLDIACFFKGWDRDLVTSLLEACDFFPASGIEVLSDKALITISYPNRIKMHDLIQEMGREIVHQEHKDPGKRSRLWKHEEVHHVLKHNKGTDVVEGIILNLHELTGDLYLSSDSLGKMINLRGLGIHGGDRNKFNLYLPNGLESLSDKLRCLYWAECCLEFLPTHFCAEQLVVLFMPRSKLKKLWGGVQNLVNLKTINLEDSRNLIEIPDLSKAEKLESVYLGKCESLCQLHPSMASRPKLTYLDLTDCRKIKSLHLIVHSKSLPPLNGCSSLKEISVTSDTLENLDLYGSGCRVIESLNVQSKSLSTADLSGCSYLKEILVTSEEMTRLYLSSTGICSLPSSIVHLLSLQGLDLSGNNIENLSENIKNLSMLRRLHLDDCQKLVSLPELPPSLRELYINDCMKLVSLPKQLPISLEKLSALNCTSLETEITQRLMLQDMLRSRIPHLHQQYNNNNNNPKFFSGWYFIVPGNHVTYESGFVTANSSVTIPNLPKSDSCGFIYSIILSEGPSEYASVSYSIFEDDRQVSCGQRYLGGKKMNSDHVLFWYPVVSNLDRKNDISDMSFVFEFQYYDENEFRRGQDRIKGCGVFPVYGSESGLKLFGSSNKEILEPEYVNNENGDNPEPEQPILTLMLTEEEDFTRNDNHSCGYFIGFILKRLWRTLMGNEH